MGMCQQGDPKNSGVLLASPLTKVKREPSNSIDLDSVDRGNLPNANDLLVARFTKLFQRLVTSPHAPSLQPKNRRPKVPHPRWAAP